MPSQSTFPDGLATAPGLRLVSGERPDGGPWEFLVTSYMLGAPDGRNLGAPGYSHEFVARLFKPLLA